jgi:hypothetical protein
MQGGLHPLAEPSVASGIGDTTTWPYCDDRLNSLEISFWTDVPVPSTMAARAISLYLQTDHPLLGTFEPASFVGDLIGHRTKFCSHFLANAVLYWACVSHLIPPLPQSSTMVYRDNPPPPVPPVNSRVHMTTGI